MLYNALAVGKKTPKTAPAPWDFVTLPEKARATAIGNMHKNMVKIVCVVLEIFADKHTDARAHTHRHTHYNTLQLLPQAK